MLNFHENYFDNKNSNIALRKMEVKNLLKFEFFFKQCPSQRDLRDLDIGEKGVGGGGVGGT